MKEKEFIKDFENYLLSLGVSKDTKLTRKDRRKLLRKINKYLDKYSSKGLNQLSKQLNLPEHSSIRDLFSLINYKIGTLDKDCNCWFLSYATLLAGLDNKKSKKQKKIVSIPDLKKLNNKKFIKKLNYHLSKDVDVLDEGIMSEILCRGFSGKQLINLLHMTKRKKPAYQHKIDIVRSLVISEIERRVGKKLEFRETLGPGISRFVHRCNTGKGNLPDLFYILKPDLINISDDLEIKIDFKSLDDTDSLVLDDTPQIISNTLILNILKDKKFPMKIKVSPSDQTSNSIIKSTIKISDRSNYFPSKNKVALLYILKSRKGSGGMLKYSIRKDSGISFFRKKPISELEVSLLPGKKYYILLNLETLELIARDFSGVPTIVFPDYKIEREIISTFYNVPQRGIINIDDYFGGWEEFQDFLKTTD